MTLHLDNDLIADDLKRLKKLKDLPKDLDLYFTVHKNELLEHGRISATIAENKDNNGNRFLICKDRIKTGNLSPSSGCRLWFIVRFLPQNNIRYTRVLLYRADEEKNYPRQVCFKLFWERLKSQVGHNQFT